MQRLIVFFDGTWNDPTDQTNVYRMARSVAKYDRETRQKFFYDPGVGTDRFSRVLGGISGYGLSKNLMQGYDWLARNYTAGDEIWIFGFSRGAYTARSLAGLLRKCGLLQISTPDLLEQSEKLYRDKNKHPDNPICQDFRASYSHQVNVHFLGVWDTVGALGIPGWRFMSERGYFGWHDTQLSGIVKHAYHAMALDEYRPEYDVCFWTTQDGKKKPAQVEVEQRWFIGAHADVGGGYGENSLTDISFAWMQHKAEKSGLLLTHCLPNENAWQRRATDSFGLMANGWYARLKGWFQSGDGRIARAYDTDQQGARAVNVTVDASVQTKWGAPGSSYRPPTLLRASDFSQTASTPEQKS